MSCEESEIGVEKISAEEIKKAQSRLEKLVNRHPDIGKAEAMKMIGVLFPDMNLEENLVFEIKDGVWYFPNLNKELAGMDAYLEKEVAAFLARKRD